jgi:hypothetical protein
MRAHTYVQLRPTACSDSPLYDPGVPSWLYGSFVCYGVFEGAPHLSILAAPHPIPPNPTFVIPTLLPGPVTTEKCRWFFSAAWDTWEPVRELLQPATSALAVHRQPHCSASEGLTDSSACEQLVVGQPCRDTPAQTTAELPHQSPRVPSKAATCKHLNPGPDPTAQPSPTPNSAPC